MHAEEKPNPSSAPSSASAPADASVAAPSSDAPAGTTASSAGAGPARLGPSADRPQRSLRDFRRNPSAPPRERPPVQTGPPPVLDPQEFGTGPKLRELDALIEKELEEAFASTSTQQLFGEPDSGVRRSAPRPSGPQKGKVISIHGNDVFIDMPGGRAQGVIPLTQFGDQPPKVGDIVEYEFDSYDSANGLAILKKRGAAVTVDWSSVARGQIVEARVTGTNKGGLSVEVNGIRGFLPISQIDIYRVENPEAYLNQRLLCYVTEVDPETKNLVVSRRALLEQEREKEAERFWSELAEGQVRTGTVRSIKPFGVFVNLGAADGMIPMSELSWGRVEKAEDIVSLGQQVQVKITRVDPAARKISLSLKQLAASPWDTIDQRFKPGMRVTGSITRIADFGAFVELEPGIEGLIHISELSSTRVRRVRDVVQENQSVEVLIVSIDPATRRIALSLRAAQEEARRAEDARLQAEQQARETAEAEAHPEAKPEKPRKRNYELRGGM